MMVLGYVHFLWTDNKSVLKTPKQLSPVLANSLGGVLIIAIIISSYWLAIKPAIAARALVKAIAKIRLQLFKDSLNLGPIGINEAREQLGQMTVEILKNQEVSGETKQEVFGLFIAEMQKYVEGSLYDSRPPYYLGHFYGSIGDFNKSLLALEEAAKRSPTKDIIYFDMANVYLNLNQVDKSRSIVKKIYDLDPTCPGSAVALANTLILDRRVPEAKAILFKTFATTTVSEDRLIAFYQNGGYYNEVIPIFEVRIKENPKDPNARLGLALSLARVGDFAGAARTLEEIKTVDPALTSQVNTFLAEIRAGRIPQ
jgi:tetratricopeptide (TPR) repeat protein